MDKLKLNFEQFKLTSEQLDTEQLHIKAKNIRSSLTFEDMLQLQNDIPIFKKEKGNNTVIVYKYENNKDVEVFVNVEFRWNLEDKILDSWYTLYVDYKRDCIAEIWAEIGDERLLFSRIDKFLKQANKVFTEYNKKLIEL